jgi:3D (Asp-Asp-Asp) domain-containing protein
MLLVGCTSQAMESDAPVTIHRSDQSKPLVIKKAKGTLTQVLQKQGQNVAQLKQKYAPSIGWDQKVQPGSQVRLLCKCKVDLIMAGKHVGTYQTQKETVAGFLKERKIHLTAWHDLKTPPETKVRDGLKVIIDQYEQKIDKQVVSIPFDKKEKKDDQLEKGEKKVEKKGKKGKKIYELVMELKNGKPISQPKKRLIKEIEPVEELVAVGTKETETADSDSDAPKSGKKMVVEATAYTSSGGSRTADGSVPKRGIVAVDPSVIPLGTRMYIPGYGYGVARDTGGAVKGNIIDVYMNSESECRQWGRRTVTITILD